MMDDSDFEANDVPKQDSKKFIVPTTPERRADEAIAVALEFADVKLSLPEMVAFIDDEALRIEAEQRARLLAGLIVAPTPEQIDRIGQLHSVRNFLRACNERPAEAAERFRRLAQKNRDQ